MTTSLWLVRHATAEDQAPRGSGDRDRVLAAEGEVAADELGAVVAGLDRRLPDVVLVSPAVRTRETAARVFASLPPSAIVVDGRLYAATPDDVRYILSELVDPGRDVAVVGHNPTIASLVDALVPAQAGPARHCPPGTLAIISLPGDLTSIEPGSGTLELYRVP